MKILVKKESYPSEKILDGNRICKRGENKLWDPWDMSLRALKYLRYLFEKPHNPGNIDAEIRIAEGIFYHYINLATRTSEKVDALKMKKEQSIQKKLM